MLSFTAHVGTGHASHPMPSRLASASGHPFHHPLTAAAGLATLGHTQSGLSLLTTPASLGASLTPFHPFVGVNLQAAALALTMALVLGATPQSGSCEPSLKAAASSP